MKRILAFAWMFAAGVALAAGTDIDGNAITGETLFGDVDGSATTVGDVLDVGDFATKEDLEKATPYDYANVANLASNAAPKSALADEVTRAQAAEKANADAIAAEETRAKAAEASLEKTVAEKADASALDAYAKSADLAAVATSGSYTNLTDTPTIPSKVSDLTNDAGYLTAETETDPVFAAWKDGYDIVMDNASRITIGSGSKVTDEYGLALGWDNTSSGDYSSVVGGWNTTTGWGSTAFGVRNNAYSMYACAFGSVNTASGVNSSALGYYNNATAESSVAVGFSNTASTFLSSALGSENTASQKYAAAVGRNSKAQGESSAAFGVNATATATASAVFGVSAKANAVNSSAVGYHAYANVADSIAFSQHPYKFYLNSSTDDEGASAKSLYEYLHYELVAPTSAEIDAEDGKICSVTADTNGVSVTLFYPQENYCSHDFVLRLAPADTNGTCIAELANVTPWQFDYPTGTNAVFGTIYAPTYFTFTRTGLNRMSIFTYAATKEEE